MKQGILILAALALGAAGPAPHKVVRNTSTLDFSYEWPPEAAAIPELDLKLYNDAKSNLADAQKNAAEDQALARKQRRDFNQHDYSISWSTAGETPRLLSLQSDFGSFEGGAHPNSSYDALLWDRVLNRQVSIGSLFTKAGDLPAVTRPTYCRKLDAERRKRREGEKLDLPEFNACPKYGDLAIAPVDKNKDGRFDRLDFIASPYLAGPYVEGEYEIIVPVTAALVAALKPEYRASFEVQRQ